MEDCYVKVSEVIWETITLFLSLSPSCLSIRLSRWKRADPFLSIFLHKFKSISRNRKTRCILWRFSLYLTFNTGKLETHSKLQYSRWPGGVGSTIVWFVETAASENHPNKGNPPPSTNKPNLNKNRLFLGRHGQACCYIGKLDGCCHWQHVSWYCQSVCCLQHVGLVFASALYISCHLGEHSF